MNIKDATGEAELATKQDLNGLKTRLNARIDALEYRLTIQPGTFIMLATGILITVIKLQ